MKKIMVLFLALATILAMLAGCVEKKPSDVSENNKGTNDGSENNGVKTEIEKAYDKALASIVALDKKTENKLNTAYKQKHGMKLVLNDIDAKVGERIEGTFCYGDFENCIVIFEPTQLSSLTTKHVADEAFFYTSSFNLLGYHDGKFYDLAEAYSKGYITKEQVAIVAENHRNINQYNDLRAQ